MSVGLGGTTTAKAPWFRRNQRTIALRRNIIYVAAVAICASFAFMSPYFLTWENAEIVALQVSSTAIVACGMTFVIIAGDIDLSVGSMYALAGTLAAYLMQLGWDWVPATGVALGAGALLGVTNGALSIYAGIPAFLVTLGTLGIARGIDLVLSGTRAIPIYDQTFPQVFAGDIFTIPRPILWAAITVIASGMVLGRSIFGRHVYAVGGNREVSRLAGIRVGRVRLVNFVLCALLATFAGLIVAGRINAGQPTIGQNFELDVITAVILGGTDLFGGRGKIVGTLVGALIITVIGNGLILLGAEANVQTIVKGVVLILTVLLRMKT